MPRDMSMYRSVVSGDLWYAVPLVRYAEPSSRPFDTVTLPELPRAGDLIEDLNSYQWEVVRLNFRNDDGCIMAVVKPYG